MPLELPYAAGAARKRKKKISFFLFFFFFPVKMVFQAAVGSDVSHLGFSVLIIMEADKSPDGQGVSASWRQGG